MNETEPHIIYTIGHSTQTLTEFLNMLQSFGIKLVVDIRSMPGSRKFPWFDSESLELSLGNSGIAYVHMADLGGRRKVKKDTKNTRWNNLSFRGYADYMETKSFEDAMVKLEHMALVQPTAYMCSEAVWWRCHRSMVSDYLKVKGWNVLHIMAIGKVQDHKYTSPARIVDGNISYSDED